MDLEKEAEFLAKVSCIVDDADITVLDSAMKFQEKTADVADYMPYITGGLGGVGGALLGSHLMKSRQAELEKKYGTKGRDAAGSSTLGALLGGMIGAGGGLAAGRIGEKLMHGQGVGSLSGLGMFASPKTMTSTMSDGTRVNTQALIDGVRMKEALGKPFLSRTTGVIPWIPNALRALVGNNVLDDFSGGDAATRLPMDMAHSALSSFVMNKIPGVRDFPRVIGDRLGDNNFGRVLKSLSPTQHLDDTLAVNTGRARKLIPGVSAPSNPGFVDKTIGKVVSPANASVGAAVKALFEKEKVVNDANAVYMPLRSELRAAKAVNAKISDEKLKAYFEAKHKLQAAGTPYNQIDPNVMDASMKNVIKGARRSVGSTLANDPAAVEAAGRAAYKQKAIGNLIRGYNFSQGLKLVDNLGRIVDRPVNSAWNSIFGP